MPQSSCALQRAVQSAHDRIRTECEEMNEIEIRWKGFSVKLSGIGAIRYAFVGLMVYLTVDNYGPDLFSNLLSALGGLDN